MALVVSLTLDHVRGDVLPPLLDLPLLWKLSAETTSFVWLRVLLILFSISSPTGAWCPAGRAFWWRLLSLGFVPISFFYDSVLFVFGIFLWSTPCSPLASWASLFVAQGLPLPAGIRPGATPTNQVGGLRHRDGVGRRLRSRAD